MEPFIRLFGEVRPTGAFVQIGASAEPGRAPLLELFSGGGWTGLVVEPLPDALEQLRQRYGRDPRINFERAAIAGDDVQRPFYYVVRADPVPDDAAGVPGSLRHEALLFRRRFSGAIEDQVAEIPTQCLTFDTLAERHRLGTFDVLLLDTGGEDDAILAQIDLDRFRPALVVYDSGHLTPHAARRAAARLRQHGYQTLEDGADTWGLRADALSDLEAETLRAVWRWTAARSRPGRALQVRSLLRQGARRVLGGKALQNGSDQPFPLTDAERRYLANGYDDSVALPVGADAYLSPSNPRLLELRRIYQSLELPAVEHHMWSPSRVAEAVDIRYFRGDNLFQWHYPDHPRAMALSLFIYMRYLQQRGGADLLDALSEDGLFGCWTAEVTGYGKVSRDLLDSVNQLLFLDRQLSVLGGRSLRVLDIGAGYGRLAHRMTAAIASLDDYACVDAVPESTFLCEYYLAFRACSPPARVVSLDQVRALEPGSFDLAVNIHSFSECTLAAIEWWAGELRRLAVPHLLVVPNEADGMVSREADGSYHDAMPALEAAGYKVLAKERVIADPAVRDMVRINDNFYLFERSSEQGERSSEQGERSSEQGERSSEQGHR